MKRLLLILALACAGSASAATPPPSYYVIRQYQEGTYACAVWLTSPTVFIEQCKLVAATKKKAGLKS